MNLNEKLKKIRLDNHLTQRELSEKLNVSYSMIQKIEIGQLKISNDFLYKFSEFFNIPINDLISNADINRVLIEIEKNKTLSKNEVLLQAILLMLKNDGYSVNEGSNIFNISNNNLTLDIPKNDLITISESIKNHLIDLLKIYNL